MYHPTIIVLNDRREIFRPIEIVIRQFHMHFLGAITIEEGWSSYLAMPNALAIFVDGSMPAVSGTRVLPKGYPSTSEEFVQAAQADGYTQRGRLFASSALSDSNKLLLKCGCTYVCEPDKIPELLQTWLKGDEKKGEVHHVP